MDQFSSISGSMSNLASGAMGSGGKKCPPIPKKNQVYADLCTAIKNASPEITKGFIDSFTTVFATGPTDPKGSDLFLNYGEKKEIVQNEIIKLFIDGIKKNISKVVSNIDNTRFLITVFIRAKNMYNNLGKFNIFTDTIKIDTFDSWLAELKEQIDTQIGVAHTDTTKVVGGNIPDGIMAGLANAVPGLAKKTGTNPDSVPQNKSDSANIAVLREQFDKALGNGHFNHELQVMAQHSVKSIFDKDETIKKLFESKKDKIEEVIQQSLDTIIDIFTDEGKLKQLSILLTIQNIEQKQGFVKQYYNDETLKKKYPTLNEYIDSFKQSTVHNTEKLHPKGGKRSKRIKRRKTIKRVKK